MSLSIKHARREFLKVLQSKVEVLLYKGEHTKLSSTYELRSVTHALTVAVYAELKAEFGESVRCSSFEESASVYYFFEGESFGFIYDFVTGVASVEMQGEAMPYAWDFGLVTDDPIQVVNNWRRYVEHLQRIGIPLEYSPPHSVA